VLWIATGRGREGDAAAAVQRKIYYDIVASPRRAQTPHVKIGRVELLYPSPARRSASTRVATRISRILW